METGTKLKKLREKKRISQEELAHLLGVSQVTVGKWEQGSSIKHEYIKKLADVFEIPADYLLEEKEVKIVNNTDNKENSINAFEITIKTPNSVIEGFFTRIDKLIHLMEKNSNP